ncbi:MAG TPA: hypothetical protein VLT32_08465, partial [Candidatus Sulfomarinibacteraceae bacterium]|nr:hypothetical protein [Candidatus Sulfomarinibacteraceae bacterium]
MDGLDERGSPCVVAEGVSELGDGVGEGVVRDELGGPDGVDDLLPGHDLARPPGQAEQHVHRLDLDLDRLAVPGHAVEPRLDEAVTEPEG